MTFPLRTGDVCSEDGTRIRYYVAGRGPGVWVAPPGLGAPFRTWHALIEHFQDALTFVTWDGRGFHGSAEPADPAAYRVEDSVRDMRAVCMREGLTRFVLGGWSMAVQIALEYDHKFPGEAQALLLFNGPFEHALAGVAPHPYAHPLLDGAARVAEAAGPLLKPLSRGLLGRAATAKAMRAAGLVAKNPEAFVEILREFGQNDWTRYFRAMRCMHRHSAASYLPQVRVPTLITAGTRDWMTPLRVGQAAHRAIPGSELVVFDGATHYVLNEFPERINAAVEDFVRRRVPALFDRAAVDDRDARDGAARPRATSILR